MPSKPATICGLGCPGLVRNGVCSVCGNKRNREKRPSAVKRGYNNWWWNKQGTGAAQRYLRENPLCVECQKEGRITPATEVDHVQPHKGNERLMHDRFNWQGLCKRHHSQKTGRGE